MSFPAVLASKALSPHLAIPSNPISTCSPFSILGAVCPPHFTFLTLVGFPKTGFLPAPLAPPFLLSHQGLPLLPVSHPPPAHRHHSGSHPRPRLTVSPPGQGEEEPYLSFLTVREPLTLFHQPPSPCLKELPGLPRMSSGLLTVLSTSQACHLVVQIQILHLANLWSCATSQFLGLISVYVQGENTCAPRTPTTSV